MSNYYLHLLTYLIIKKKQLLNVISLKKTKTYTPFVILCEPRSGSTLLHTLLNSHTQIKSYGEVLREKLGNHRSSPTNPVSTFVFKPHAPTLKAIGLKLFYFYYEDPLYATSFQEIVRNKDVKIIHLIRKDSIALYVSLKIAQETNHWTSVTTTSHDTGNNLQIDTEDFRQFSTTYRERQQHFNNLFQRHSMLTISYEDLNSNPKQISNEIQQFLGVKVKQLFSLLKKQNPNTIESRLINYADAKSIVDEINKKF